jgi:ferredoxin
MNVKLVRLVYFSPTNTTKQIVEAIAKGTQLQPIAHLDLTCPEEKSMVFEDQNELTIIGAPVYGGRIPVDAVIRFQRLKAHDIPAVVVVVYGNREYEDALLELRDIAFETGFRPIAGGAFIGEHSYSTEEKPVAQGRPDADDVEKAKEFGRAIWEMVAGIAASRDIQPLSVPGDFPYKERSERSNDVAPVTRESLCIKCGRCVEVCPKAAITIGETLETDPSLCIFCSACIKSCPSGAKVWEHPRIIRAREFLHSNFSKRKELETYLS